MIILGEKKQNQFSTAKTQRSQRISYKIRDFDFFSICVYRCSSVVSLLSCGEKSQIILTSSLTLFSMPSATSEMFCPSI